MHTLTVDDRELVVTQMNSILSRLDPDGVHLGATTGTEALRLAGESPLDVAFLDVEMPGDLDGLSLGRRLRARYPRLNIVFITGHQEYAMNAFELDASGYLGKIRIRCFGPFEAYCGGVPLDFSYSKSKELLACLVDHYGALCSNDTLIGTLWPDEPADQHTKARLRKCVKDLKDVFAAAGAADVIRHQERIGLGLDVSRLDCDYYRYLQGDPMAVHQFSGKYMTQYAFAEETRASLQYEQTSARGE